MAITVSIVYCVYTPRYICTYIRVKLAKYTSEIAFAASGYHNSYKFERFTNRFSRCLSIQYYFLHSWPYVAILDFYFMLKNIFQKFYNKLYNKKN